MGNNGLPAVETGGNRARVLAREYSRPVARDLGRRGSDSGQSSEGLASSINLMHNSVCGSLLSSL